MDRMHIFGLASQAGFEPRPKLHIILNGDSQFKLKYSPGPGLVEGTVQCNVQCN